MLYEFRTGLVIKPDTSMRPGPGQNPSSAKQLAHVQGGRTNILTGGPSGGSIDPTDVEDYLMPGFWALDASMKMYWSGMRVPTRDSYRFCRIKIAGGDKSFMVWRDDMVNGRARLPVASLSRGKVEFNKDRFSPPYLSMAMKYPTRRGDRALLVYRPTPWLVEYTMSVWAEHKIDAEHLQYQIITRFNPLAVFRMCDGHIKGDVTLRFGGAADQSEKEVSADQNRMVKYDFTMTAEAWLPLPERLVPTVLGHVVSVKDSTSGDVLQSIMNHQAVF